MYNLSMSKKEEYRKLKKFFADTKDEPLENMDGFFDARIEFYEEHMSHWRRHYEYVANVLPTQTRNLLDLGCGSGLELDAIFTRFPLLDVTGVDLSESMLAKLKNKHADKNLTLKKCDYFDFDAGENVFDAAVAFETLHHFTAAKKRKLFEKIFRSLVSGGIFIDCDYIALSQEIENAAFDECSKRRRKYSIPPLSYVHFDTPLTLKHELSALKKAGFINIKCFFLPHERNTAIITARKY